MKDIQLSVKSPLKSKIESWALILGLCASITGVIGYSVKDIFATKEKNVPPVTPIEVVENVHEKTFDTPVKRAPSPVQNKPSSQPRNKTEFNVYGNANFDTYVNGDHANITLETTIIK